MEKAWWWGGGATALAVGALPVIAMAGVFLALGSGYAEARAAVRAEETASGFSQGFVIGLLGWNRQQAVDRFGRRSVLAINQFDEASGQAKVMSPGCYLRLPRLQPVHPEATAC